MVASCYGNRRRRSSGGQLVINWKTAKALGLTIPESVRLQAHRVID
jgi:ABC-type uncharacterized transport system substrate-binding protein